MLIPTPIRMIETVVAKFEASELPEATKAGQPEE